MLQLEGPAPRKPPKNFLATVSQTSVMPICFHTAGQFKCPGVLIFTQNTQSQWRALLTSGSRLETIQLLDQISLSSAQYLKHSN